MDDFERDIGPHFGQDRADLGKRLLLTALAQTTTDRSALVTPHPSSHHARHERSKPTKFQMAYATADGLDRHSEAAANAASAGRMSAVSDPSGVREYVGSASGRKHKFGNDGAVAGL